MLLLPSATGWFCSSPRVLEWLRVTQPPGYLTSSLALWDLITQLLMPLGSSITTQQPVATPLLSPMSTLLTTSQQYLKHFAHTLAGVPSDPASDTSDTSSSTDQQHPVNKNKAQQGSWEAESAKQQAQHQQQQQLGEGVKAVVAAQVALMRVASSQYPSPDKHIGSIRREQHELLKNPVMATGSIAQLAGLAQLLFTKHENKKKTDSNSSSGRGDTGASASSWEAAITTPTANSSSNSSSKRRGKAGSKGKGGKGKQKAKDQGSSSASKVEDDSNDTQQMRDAGTGPSSEPSSNSPSSSSSNSAWGNPPTKSTSTSTSSSAKGPLSLDGRLLVPDHELMAVAGGAAAVAAHADRLAEVLGSTRITPALAGAFKGSDLAHMLDKLRVVKTFLEPLTLLRYHVRRCIAGDDPNSGQGDWANCSPGGAPGSLPPGHPLLKDLPAASSSTLQLVLEVVALLIPEKRCDLELVNGFALMSEVAYAASDTTCREFLAARVDLLFRVAQKVALRCVGQGKSTATEGTGVMAGRGGGRLVRQPMPESEQSQFFDT